MCAATGFAQSKSGTKTTPVAKNQSTPAAKNVNVVNATVTALPVSAPHVGRYELYAGVHPMYIGHFILLSNGKYKVAFDTDENNYDETGKYTYNSATNTIEWISGMFKNNNWGGKFEKNEKGFHIQLNKNTYADSK